MVVEGGFGFFPVINSSSTMTFGLIQRNIVTEATLWSIVTATSLPKEFTDLLLGPMKVSNRRLSLDQLLLTVFVPPS